MTVCWQLLRINLVRSNFAGTVVIPLTIAPIGAVAALGTIAAVIAVSPSTSVAPVTVAATTIAMAAAELALPRLLSLDRGIGSLSGAGVGQLRRVYYGGRGLTLGRIDAGILRLGRGTATPTSCAGLGLLDLALAVIGWCLIQGFLVRQLRSSSSGTVGIWIQ
jgi:hypothetical protein